MLQSSVVDFVQSFDVFFVAQIRSCSSYLMVFGWNNLVHFHSTQLAVVSKALKASQALKKAQEVPVLSYLPKVATKRGFSCQHTCLGDNMAVDLFKVFRKKNKQKKKHLHNILIPSQIRNPLRSTCPEKNTWIN